METTKKTETVSFKVTPEEKEKLKKMAADQNTTVSRIVHALVFKEQFAAQE